MTAGPSADLELILFATEPAWVARGRKAGLGSFLVDLEHRGKAARQRGVDTEINSNTPRDLRTLLEHGAPRRYCRLDRLGPWTRIQVEAVLAGQPTHVLLPMVESAREVETLIELVNGRAAVAILIETEHAVARVEDLAQLPIEAVYVGLNDLAISRGTTSIWRSLVDGTVERVRAALTHQRFGVAGVTVVDGGRPIPASLLLAEMARLACDFSFLRRSFRRDTADRDWCCELGHIEAEWRRLRARTVLEVAADRHRFVDSVAALEAVGKGVAAG